VDRVSPVNAPQLEDGCDSGRSKGEAERWCIPAANGARCRQNGTPRAMRRRARCKSAASKAQRARVCSRRRREMHDISSRRVGMGTGCMSTMDTCWVLHHAKALVWASDRQLRSHASRCTHVRNRAPASPDCEQESVGRPRRHGASRVQLPARPYCLQRVGATADCLICAGPCLELGSSICYRHNPKRRHLQLARDSTVPCVSTLFDCPDCLEPSLSPAPDRRLHCTPGVIAPCSIATRPPSLWCSSLSPSASGTATTTSPLALAPCLAWLLPES
jgi:hypothetical protein